MATPTFFMGLLGVLVAMTLLLFIIAQNIVEPDLKLDDPEVAEAIQQRIEPIGRLNTGDAPVAVAAASPLISEAQAAPGFGTGEAVYNGVCQACHTTGILNSPKLGDPEGWGARLSKSREELVLSVINGLNLMPPKGGRPDLTDEQVEMAVDYMLESLN